MFVLIIIGFILGVLTILALQFLYFFVSFGPTVEETFSQQFVPFRIPFELKQILISPNRDEQLKKKESCLSINLLLQFLYQEFRDSKSFRRWMLKKLQMEFNELLSRSASGKLLKDIKLRSLTTGQQFPVIKNIHSQNVKLSDDENSFETLDLVLEVEYRGGFELSVDVIALLGQQASLSVHVTKLAGEARLQLNRRPYSHWSFSFVQEPTMEFKVDSKFHGRPLPHLVPLIINQFRRTVRKRHVLPAYKLRFRPFFHNPLFQPSPDPNEFSHISMTGCLKLTILNCSRLNLSVIPTGHVDVYCALMTVAKPHIFGQQSNYVSIAIKFVRYSAVEPIGLILGREFIAEKGSKQIAVLTIEKGSVADRTGFRTGDLILAVNNISILTERQAAKMLSNTVGEMIVIVERELSKIDNEDEVMDQLFGLTGQQNGDDKNIKVELNSDGFIHVNYDSPTASDDSTTGGTLLKAKSFVDLTKSNEEVKFKSNIVTPALNFEQHLNVNDSSYHNDQDSNTNVLRKVRSASVFVIPPESNSSSKTSVPQDLASDTKSMDSVGLEFIASTSDVDNNSISSESPHLSRKQRIAERAAQMAQKFSTGKATVKEMIGKRIKRSDESVPSFSSTVQMQKRKTESSIDSAGQIFVPASKSEEAQLGLRVVTSNIHANVARTRSKSEPDTMVLTVNARSRENSSSETEFSKSNGFKKEEKDDEKSSLNSNKEEDKERPSSSTNEKVAVNESATLTKQSSKKSLKLFEKSTKSLEVNENPSWNESIKVPLDNRLKYLNVLVYTKPKSTVSSKKIATENPFLLGYVNILLPEALDDCGTTKSLYHQQTYALRPSGFPKIPTAYQNLSRHPGFDSRLCFGDITLGFQWMPNEILDDVEADSAVLIKEEKLAMQEPNLDVNQPLLMDGHKWMSTHFQHATTCDVCQKKIWLKTAYKCADCSMISHKKCLIRVGSLGKCGQVHEATATDRQHSSKDSWNTEEIVEAVEAVASALEYSPTPEYSPATSGGKRVHLQHVLAEKFAGLRRRKGRGDSNKTDTDSRYSINGDSLVNPVVLPTLEDVTGDQWTTNESPFHSMLYTKGGTYNERMIYAAKDLGKDLFVDLNLIERKSKINEEIDKLQGEIDVAIQQRLEVLTKDKNVDQSSPARQHLRQEINKFDDRLQALAILMLHYCAGLQHCLDLEEANASSMQQANGEESGGTGLDDVAGYENDEESVALVDAENLFDKNLINLCNNNV